MIEYRIRKKGSYYHIDMRKGFRFFFTIFGPWVRDCTYTRDKESEAIDYVLYQESAAARRAEDKRLDQQQESESEIILKVRIEND